MSYFISVLTTSIVFCLIAGLSSVIIILRRVINPGSIFFSLFILGAALYVFFYLFLFVEELKYYHYFLDVIAINLGNFSFFMFSYSIRTIELHIKRMIIIFIPILAIHPILCLVFTPYTFINVSYGVELDIQPWFLISFMIVGLSIITSSIINIFNLNRESPSLELRRKIKIILSCMLMILFFVLTFLVIIPLTLNIHYLKPIGYFGLAFSLILMTYAFKKEEA